MLIKKFGESIFPMLLGLLAGLMFFTFRIIGFDFGYFPGDLADGRLVLYILEHAHQFFTGSISDFWNAPFMYPEKNVLAYSENLLGSAPIYSLFRLLGFDIYRSYQLWFLVVSALNYLAAFYFLKYVFKHNYSAALGAFVFAFSIALVSQIAHPQTFPRFAVPLAFLMVFKFGEALNPKYLFFAVLLVVYQIYCGIYLGFMLAIPVGLFLLLIIIKKGLFENADVFKPKWLIQVLSYGLLNVLILLPLMFPYMERKIAPTDDHFSQISQSIPTIVSHFYSRNDSLVWEFLSQLGQSYETPWNHQIFAGAIATICLAIVSYFMISNVVKSKFRLNHFSVPFLFWLTGLLTFILFIRFDDITAYIALYYLPGFSAMRILTRIINIELIFFAFATTFVFSKLHIIKSKYWFAIFLSALTLLIIDNYSHSSMSYRTELSVAKERTGRLDHLFAQIPEGSVVSYEPENMDGLTIFYQVDAMLASQKYGLTSINGYTAKSPSDYGMYWHEPNEKSRNYWLINKNIEPEAIYVVKNENILEKVPVNEIENYDFKTAQDGRVEYLIKRIRNDRKWMEAIERKAKERNISIDSMIVREARWMSRHEKQ